MPTAQNAGRLHAHNPVVPECCRPTVCEADGAAELRRGTKLVSDIRDHTNPPPFGTVHGPAGIRAVLEPFFGRTAAVT